MYLFTWEAGNWSGVTDDVTRALDRAAAHLAPGIRATVTMVRAELSFRTMSSFYLPAGFWWRGELVDGTAEWDGPDPEAARREKDERARLV